MVLQWQSCWWYCIKEWEEAWTRRKSLTPLSQIALPRCQRKRLLLCVAYVWIAWMFRNKVLLMASFTVHPLSHFVKFEHVRAKCENRIQD